MSSNHNTTPPDMSVRVTSEEARGLTELSRAIREAEAKYKPLPQQRDIASAGPAGDPGYVSRLLARAEQGGHGSNTDTVSDKDAGRLPPANPATLDPRSGGGDYPRTMATLRPGDTIAYAGTRIEVSHAVREGLLVPDQTTGGYRVPTNEELASEKAREQVEQEKAEYERQADMPAQIEAGDQPDLDTQTAAKIAAQYVPAETIQAVIQDAVSNDGTISLRNVHEAAARAGIPTADAEKLTQRLYQGTVRQAERVAITAGVPADQVGELWSWAANHAPVAHRHAAMAIAFGNDATGIRALAQMWLSHQRDVKRNKE